MSGTQKQVWSWHQYSYQCVKNKIVVCVRDINYSTVVHYNELMAI